MPYSDSERGRQAANERKRRYRERKHAEKYGPGADDQRGKGRKATGAAHHRWSADRILNEDGYAKVRAGRDHPLADPNGYAYEHLVIWCAAGNPRPGPGELLHHKNEDKADNRLDNLELLTRAEHNRRHNAERERDARGRIVGKKAAGRLLDGRTWDEVPS